MKRGVSLSINVVVIGILAIIVLAFLLILLARYTGDWNEAADCKSYNEDFDCAQKDQCVAGGLKLPALCRGDGEVCCKKS